MSIQVIILKGHNGPGHASTGTPSHPFQGRLISVQNINTLENMTLRTDPSSIDGFYSLPSNGMIWQFDVRDLSADTFLAVVEVD